MVTSRWTIRTGQNKGGNVERHYNREVRLDTMGTSPREGKGETGDGEREGGRQRYPGERGVEEGVGVGEDMPGRGMGGGEGEREE